MGGVGGASQSGLRWTEEEASRLRWTKKRPSGIRWTGEETIRHKVD
jgi:hypothetical protein